MRRLAAVLTLLLAALAAFAPSGALALAVPPHGGQWVVDTARLLPPAEKDALGAELRRYAETSGNQIVILTVPSLEGESIAAYANRVAREWGVGRKDANTGVLILVAKAEARVRFEVGRGLEDRLTDVLSKRIQREVTVPQFRAGRFGAGLTETVRAIQQALAPSAAAGGADTAPLEPVAPAPQAKPQPKDDGFPWLTLGLVVVATVLAIALLSRRRGPGHGVGYGQGYGGGYDDGGGRGSSFLLGMLLGMFSSRWRGPGGPGGSGGFGGGDGGFSGGGGDFGGGGSDSGFGGGDENS